MRLLIAIMILLTINVPSFAEEMWACDGMTSSRDGSSTGPFLIRGNTNFYQWRSDIKSFELKKVGDNGVVDFDIYVDVSSNTHRHAYYIKKDGDEMEIRQFLWRSYIFYANCVRQ